MDLLTMLDRYGLPLLGLVVLGKFILMVRADAIREREQCNENLATLHSDHKNERKAMHEQFERQANESNKVIKLLTDAINSFVKGLK